nr:MAG TPA: hypothetical protein [Caudoviricetes sp.]
MLAVNTANAIGLVGYLLCRTKTVCGEILVK